MTTGLRKKQLCERAGQKPRSMTIVIRRLRLFGHICRLLDSVSTKKKALYECLRKTKKKLWGSETKIESSMMLAKDRKERRKFGNESIKYNCELICETSEY